MLSRTVLFSDPEHDLVALKFNPSLNYYNVSKTNIEGTCKISQKMCAKTTELSPIGGEGCLWWPHANGLEMGISFLAEQIKQEIGMENTIYCVVG